MMISAGSLNDKTSVVVSFFRYFLFHFFISELPTKATDKISILKPPTMSADF